MGKRRRWVNPASHRIVKFLPTMPPERGDIVLVDGERCQVVKVKIRWDGATWHLDGVKVKPA